MGDAHGHSGSAEIWAFVQEHLPPEPARILEVGCGRGEVARAIADAGHDVVAIDPEAPTGALFRRESLETFADPGPFDAVVASRSLHHIANLPRALDKIANLLAKEGRIIVNEHAWDRFDERTARWYLRIRSGIDPEAPSSVERCLAEWQHDHAGLHTYAAMRKELDRRFIERFFAWTPYLYGELSRAVDEREERALIESGEIQATGFRYIGERPIYLGEVHRRDRSQTILQWSVPADLSDPHAFNLIRRPHAYGADLGV
jgi:SAM-dependent methyltransferase